MYANTQLTCARFIPSGVQILATGNDRHISYWEVYDASLVRDVEGSAKGAVNCLSLNSTGDVFATAGVDQTLRVRIPLVIHRRHSMAKHIDCCSSFGTIKAAFRFALVMAMRLALFHVNTAHAASLWSLAVLTVRLLYGMCHR